MEYGEATKNLGIAFAEAVLAGKKLDAIKLLRRLAVVVHSTFNGENYGQIDLLTAKKFFEGVESVVVNKPKIDHYEKELLLYKAFRQKNFTVGESINAVKIAMEALEKV